MAWVKIKKLLLFSELSFPGCQVNNTLRGLSTAHLVHDRNVLLAEMYYSKLSFTERKKSELHFTLYPESGGCYRTASGMEWMFSWVLV